MTPPIRAALLVAGCLLTLAGRLFGEGHVNVLFIITDQQRFDALSRAGNTELQTPHLDRLASEGAFFLNAYTPSPICVPARSAILTGHTIASIHVTRNSDVKQKDVIGVPSFDSILAGRGYHTEYYGKWHAPYGLARCYENPVRPNASNEGDSVRTPTQHEAYWRYVESVVGPLFSGEQKSLLERGRIFLPDLPQWPLFGRLNLPPQASRTAFTVLETMASLKRLRGRPFSITCSIDAPHPPFFVVEPYSEMFPPDELEIPATIHDPLTNSPYASLRDDFNRNVSSQDVTRLKSRYFAMVREVDDWIGRLLETLRELGLEQNTLVIFTSDHGEMLGDHGLRDKALFYEGAVHVPLILRLPGTIRAGTVIETPVSTVNLFATILDYAGQPGWPSQGRSLRGLLEKTEIDGPDYCVSERFQKRLPSFMLRTARWKLLFGCEPGERVLDALYDLEKDPLETTNLIGNAPDRQLYRGITESLKSRLVEWLIRVDSPHLEGVRRRPVMP